MRKHLIIFALFAFYPILFIFEVQAQLLEGRIICTGPREAETILISQAGNLSFQRHLDRSPSSVLNSGPVQRVQNGIRKIFQHQNYQYQVVIKDLSQFSEVDDYLSIRSKQGHQITFPLYCSY